MLVRPCGAVRDKDQWRASTAEVAIARLVVVRHIRVDVEAVGCAHIDGDPVIDLHRVTRNDGRAAESRIAHELNLAVTAFGIKLHALAGGEGAVADRQRAIRGKGVDTEVVRVDRRIGERDVAQLRLDECEQSVDRDGAARIVSNVHIALLRDEIQFGR